MKVYSKEVWPNNLQLSFVEKNVISTKVGSLMVLKYKTYSIH